MPFSWTILPLLLVGAFSLSTWLEPRFQAWSGSRTKSSDMLSVALGDSRRLFARHFYVKADAYFHSGYYPTIFDNSPSERLHIASTQSGRHEAESSPFLGKPNDWIDRFSRHFYPSTHRHLGEKEGKGHHHEPGEKCEHDDDSSGEERELLPWLKLSAQLDPEQPETYVIAAYWLRSRLGKIDEAEQFLRAGLQANPGQYEILFELGRIYYENRKQTARARNVWELALKSWREQATHPEQDRLVYEQLLGQLARLEEQEKNYLQAITYLQDLKVISPSKTHIEKWIEELKQKAAHP